MPLERGTMPPLADAELPVPVEGVAEDLLGLQRSENPDAGRVLIRHFHDFEQRLRVR